MFDHMGFDVRDYEKSKKFYEIALAPLGIKLLSDSAEWKAAGFGITRPQFWVAQGEPRNGVDEVHLCFSAQSRVQVREFYEAAIKAGARDNGKPGLRPQYHKNYYGAFILDLDGHNIEACCHLPE